MLFSSKIIVVVAAMFGGSAYAACDFFDSCSAEMVFCGATDTEVVCCDNNDCGTSPIRFRTFIRFELDVDIFLHVSANIGIVPA